MHQILSHNLALQQLKQTTSLLDQFPATYPAETTKEDEPQFLFTESACKHLQKLLHKAKQMLNSIRQ